MPDHVPRRCAACDGPMTARRECTRCGRRSERAATAMRPAARPDAGVRRRLARDPLTEWMDALGPWIRGQRGIW